MAIPESFELFFDLPSELREQILGCLLIKPHAIQIMEASPRMERTSWLTSQHALSSSSDDDEDYEDEDEPYGPRWPLNYFLVSHTFKREATATYFRENTFHICPKGTKVPPAHLILSRNYRSRCVPFDFKDVRVGNALLLNPAWTSSVHRIRNMVVYIQRLRGFMEQSVFQPLLDMILAGGLKNLEFRVGFTSRGESMFSALPMRCMYRVLTDPDLLGARLSIPAQDHESVWCAFHKNGGDGRERCAMSRGRVRKPSSGWLDVDVAALVHKYGDSDDQFRILKVGD